MFAIHRDVERADGNLRAAELADEPGDAVGQWDAASRDAQEDETVGAAVGLEDLVRDPSQRSGDVGLVQHGARAHAAPFSASRDGVKGCWRSIHSTGAWDRETAAAPRNHPRRPPGR